MTSELATQRQHWRRYLAWVRCALGVACLVAQLVLKPSAPRITILCAIFALYSLLAAVWGWARAGIFAVLALFIDTVFFLVLATYGADQSLWLASLFFLYLAVALTVTAHPREVLLVTGASLAFSLLAQHSGIHLFRRMIFAAGALACISAVYRRRLEARISNLTLETKRSREQAEQARESERQRIAADFHDGPLQSFISFQMRLDILRKLFQRDLQAGLKELEQIAELWKSQVRELRAFVRRMRPVQVDGASLMASTRRLIEDFQKESGIATTFVSSDSSIAASPEISAEILQMLREALHNIQKHARATRVAVGMEKASKMLEISIDDNGIGFPFSGAYTLEELELLRMGPVSLERRARSLGADLLLDSQPGRGTGLKLKIPM